MSDRPDWMNLIAKERGVPVDWTWFHAEWKGDGPHAVMLVKGGVPGGAFKSGKNKGNPNPRTRTDVREIVITRGDLDAVKAKWSAETGKCHECCGTGQAFWQWRKADGTKTKDCKACGATGISRALFELAGAG